MDEGMRAERRGELYALLGELPERHRPIGAELTAREERDQYVLEVLLLDGDVALGVMPTSQEQACQAAIDWAAGKARSSA
jgi:hypothetical protein